MDGFRSNNNNGVDDNFGGLPSDLAALGIADRKVFGYSYTGGQWAGNTWTPWRYGPSDVH